MFCRIIFHKVSYDVFVSNNFVVHSFHQFPLILIGVPIFNYFLFISYDVINSIA